MDQLLEFLMGFNGVAPYLLVFLILLGCGVGVPIPEDITLFAAGLLAYFGNANVFLMIAVAYGGVMVGDSTIFILGSRFGPQLIRRKFFARIFHAERMIRAEQRLVRWGNKLIFMARFMPGLRAPVFFTSGTLKLPFRVFFFYDGLAALISVPAIVYAVYHFGDDIEYIAGLIRNVQNAVVLVIAAMLLVIVGKWFWKRRSLRRVREGAASEQPKVERSATAKS